MPPIIDYASYYKSLFEDSENERKKLMKERNALKKLIPSISSTGRPTQMTLRSRRTLDLEERIYELKAKIKKLKGKSKKNFQMERELNNQLFVMKKCVEEKSIRETALLNEKNSLLSKLDKQNKKYSQLAKHYKKRKAKHQTELHDYEQDVFVLKEELKEAKAVNFAAQAAYEGTLYVIKLIAN
jgi:chromosome segregation ATPase